jgi:hypothetical protein
LDASCTALLYTTLSLSPIPFPTHSDGIFSCSPMTVGFMPSVFGSRCTGNPFGICHLCT